MYKKYNCIIRDLIINVQFIGELKFVPVVEICSAIICKLICNEKSISIVESGV